MPPSPSQIFRPSTAVAKPRECLADHRQREFGFVLRWLASWRERIPPGFYRRFRSLKHRMHKSYGFLIHSAVPPADPPSWRAAREKKQGASATSARPAATTINVSGSRALTP